jgi:hypothetical protein
MYSKLLAAIIAISFAGTIPAMAHDSERSQIAGDEMSDAMPTSSFSKASGSSCAAEKTTAMNAARGFDILSAIGPKTSSASEATP